MSGEWGDETISLKKYYRQQNNKLYSNIHAFICSFIHSASILLSVDPPQIQKAKVNIIIHKAHFYYYACNSSLWLIQRQLINEKSNGFRCGKKYSNLMQRNYLFKIAPGFPSVTKPVAPKSILSSLINTILSHFHQENDTLAQSY